MDKKHVAEICKIIAYSYHNVSFSKEKLEVWERLLRDQDFEKIMSNTTAYVKQNEFPPSVSQVINFNNQSRRPTRNTLEQIERKKELAEKQLEQLDGKK